MSTDSLFYLHSVKTDRKHTIPLLKQWDTPNTKEKEASQHTQE